MIGKSDAIRQQLPLAIRLPEEVSFADYYAGRNAVTVGTLRQALADPTNHLIYLWGSAGVGVSHLLQAAVRELQQAQLEAAYLSISELEYYGPEVLTELSRYRVLALDDMGWLSGRAHWQQALFHLYNRMQPASGLLLVGSRCSPLQLPFELEDLRSRLASGITLKLTNLEDAERVEWLVWKANQLGMTIALDAAKFLVARHSQRLDELMITLNQLDTASLSAQRKITIPFIKQSLNF